MQVGPTALIEALHASLQNLEHEFDIGARTVHHREGVGAEGRGEVAVSIASEASALDDHRGRRSLEPTEHVKDSGAALLGMAVR